MATQDMEKSKGGRPLLILLPVLILAGLFIAPTTRALLKTQCILLFDSTAFAARLRDMGVKTGPMPTVQKWEQSRPVELVAHYPDDYTLQLAGALLAGTNTTGGYGPSPQDQYANFQRRFGVRLTALALRFPNRPDPYAHLLRFMTMGTVRVSREGEAAKFQTVKTGSRDRQVGYAESWAAFDNAAAQGEKVDPDNAYFPLMRAVGLFDAKRDAEGIAAVLRAGQKKRFEDYSLEEPESTWALYRRTYGADSILLRESSYYAVLLPHFAAIRSMARLTLEKAAQAEHDGRPQEGLALRHAMMQSAVRMREQGGTLSALVGNAIFSMTMHVPGGVVDAPLARDATDDQKYTAARERYLAYLHRLGQTEEAAWVNREDAANKQVRDLIHASENDNTQNAALQALTGFWIVDMLLLANTLGILWMCSMAVLMGRPNMRSGEKALPWATLLVLVFCMIFAFQMQWAESLTQMRIVLDNLSASPDGSGAMPDGMRMSEVITRFPGVIHVGEVLLSLAAPVLTLIVAGGTGLIRKLPFSTALLRALQRGALIFTTLLAISYALTLFATARLEQQANAALDARTQNGVAYLRHLAESGRKL
jgi:hypothetical protein